MGTARKHVHDAEPRPPFPARKLGGTGEEAKLVPRPRYRAPEYRPAGKLRDKVALISGGDSGIGRAVALIYAREGADVSIVYHSHDRDADETRAAVESQGRRCSTIKGDVGSFEFCRDAVERTVKELGSLDILVVNAAFQERKPGLEELDIEQLEHTLRTNVLGYFFLAKAGIPRMLPGSCIIATGSETGIFGSPQLLDYSATKGAIHALTRSLAQNLVDKGIRVNAVAPGPVWTPLNPSDRGMSADQVAHFGEKTDVGRPAQPEEIAPAYVFLASNADSGFITGQVIAELGGATK